MNDFDRDNAWQKGMRDRLLGPYLYGRYAVEGRYVYVDKERLAEVLQRRYAVDTILQRPGGRAICLEEKIVRWKGRRYECACLETHSCTVPGHESECWMAYGRADWLNYCFETAHGGLDCWLINFPNLQRWFWSRENDFARFQMTNTINKSMGRVVPLAAIAAAVPTSRRFVRDEREQANPACFLCDGIGVFDNEICFCVISEMRLRHDRVLASRGAINEGRTRHAVR